MVGLRGKGVERGGGGEGWGYIIVCTDNDFASHFAESQLISLMTQLFYTAH